MAEITIKQNFGRALFIAVRVFGLKNILEIGSFDGDGSTQVLISAMRRFAQKRLVCLELCEERCTNLRTNTHKYAWVEPVCDTSISWTNFSAKDFDRDVWPTFHKMNRGNYNRIKAWWQNDVDTIRHASGHGYIERSGESFDAVLIDGGEFSGYDEFRILKNRVRCCFMLDDAFKVFKNAKAAEELRADPDWRAFHINVQDRNGTAIFCRGACYPPRLVLIARTAKAYLEYLATRYTQLPV